MTYYELAYMFVGFCLGSNLVFALRSIENEDGFKFWVAIIGLVSGLTLFAIIPIWR